MFLSGSKDLMEMNGPTEIWTRIAGFKVRSANHYTIGPLLILVLI